MIQYACVQNSIHDKQGTHKSIASKWENKYETDILVVACCGFGVDRNLDLKTDLQLLTRLARKLRNDRETLGGAVDLSSGDLGGELKFTIVDGVPTQVKPKEDKEIHHPFAEMMIFANTSVATKTAEAFPESALLRMHQTASENRFDDLKGALTAGGVRFDGSSNMALANSLKSAEEGSSRPVQSLFRTLATRAMSEALYVCPGSNQNRGNLSHYGLGLEKYTHFTSPIRRYADVIVHKQLLAALEREAKGPRANASKSKAVNTPVEPLPASNVISTMEGEGLEGLDGDDLLDALIDGAAELALDDNADEIVPEPEPVDDDTRTPYQTSDVARICDGLNLHNRLAKRSSYESQRLYLSLYFRNHAEVHSAVVVDIRANGFYCYVPRFDFRAPVYLRDKDGALQMDPALFGLSASFGESPTAGFAQAPYCRLLPGGRLEEVENELVATVSGAQFRVRPLDVALVWISCEDWDDRARRDAQGCGKGACREARRGKHRSFE